MYSCKIYLEPFFKKTYTNYLLIAGFYIFNTILVIVRVFLFSFYFKLERLYILKLLLFLRLLTLLTLLVVLLALLVIVFRKIKRLFKSITWL